MIVLDQKRITLANGIELDVVDEGPEDGEPDPGSMSPQPQS